MHLTANKSLSFNYSNLDLKIHTAYSCLYLFINKVNNVNFESHWPRSLPLNCTNITLLEDTQGIKLPNYKSEQILLFYHKIHGFSFIMINCIWINQKKNLGNTQKNQVYIIYLGSRSEDKVWSSYSLYLCTYSLNYCYHNSGSPGENFLECNKIWAFIITEVKTPSILIQFPYASITVLNKDSLGKPPSSFPVQMVKLMLHNEEVPLLLP